MRLLEAKIALPLLPKFQLWDISRRPLRCVCVEQGGARRRSWKVSEQYSTLLQS